jgi:hypothetical protein
MSFTGIIYQFGQSTRITEIHASRKTTTDTTTILTYTIKGDAPILEQAKKTFTNCCSPIVFGPNGLAIIMLDYQFETDSFATQIVFSPEHADVLKKMIQIKNLGKEEGNTKGDPPNKKPSAASNTSAAKKNEED